MTCDTNWGYTAMKTILLVVLKFTPLAVQFTLLPIKSSFLSILVPYKV